MKTIISTGIILLLLVLLQSTSIAQIPQVISYQGVLSDTTGNPKPDGSYTLTFSLYDTSTGGMAIWNETKVLVTRRGLFHTVLGDQTPFGASVKFNKPYWLGIKVGNNPELSPRIPLTSVGYSLNSVRADTARVALSAPISSGGWSDDGTVVRLQTLTDKVGIGITNPQAPLHVSPPVATGQADVSAVVAHQRHGSGTGTSNVKGVYGKVETNSWTGTNNLYGLYGESIANNSDGSAVKQHLRCLWKINRKWYRYTDSDWRLFHSFWRRF